MNNKWINLLKDIDKKENLERLFESFWLHGGEKISKKIKKETELYFNALVEVFGSEEKAMQVNDEIIIPKLSEWEAKRLQKNEQRK